MTQSLEIKTGPHWWEASALTVTPPLLPQTGSLSPLSVDNICWEELRVLFLNPLCVVLVGFSSNWTTLLPSALWEMKNLQLKCYNGLAAPSNPSALLDS